MTRPALEAWRIRGALLVLALLHGLAFANDDDLTERGKWVKENYGSLSLNHYDAKQLGAGYAPGAMSVKGGKNPPRSSRRYSNPYPAYRAYGHRGVRHYRW